jgi:hypothetical protein
MRWTHSTANLITKEKAKSITVQRPCSIPSFDVIQLGSTIASFCHICHICLLCSVGSTALTSCRADKDVALPVPGIIDANRLVPTFLRHCTASLMSERNCAGRVAGLFLPDNSRASMSRHFVTPKKELHTASYDVSRRWISWVATEPPENVLH